LGNRSSKIKAMKKWEIMFTALNSIINKMTKVSGWAQQQIVDIREKELINLKTVQYHLFNI
jgi:hypothetical protein